MKNDVRYFWSGWIDRYSYAQLAIVFVLLSVADFLATTRMMPHGIKEGNALANAALDLDGPAGLAVYKSILVIAVLGILWLVHRSNPRLARGVLWGGITVMGVIALLHLAIISGMASGLGLRVP